MARFVWSTKADAVEFQADDDEELTAEQAAAVAALKHAYLLDQVATSFDAMTLALKNLASVVVQRPPAIPPSGLEPPRRMP